LPNAVLIPPGGWRKLTSGTELALAISQVRLDLLMKNDPTQAAKPGARSGAGRVVREAFLVAATGIILSLAANWLSPRGLELTRNYFPGAARPMTPIPPPKAAPSTNGAGSSRTNQAPAADLLAARLQASGLQRIERSQVEKILGDPRYEQDLVVLVDGRADREYQAGHIPGARQIDHYRPAAYLAEALPVCQTAGQIVVYCNGGDCEDGIFTALTLSEAGIPKEKLFIYTGGMAEWAAAGLSVEIGARQSGQLRNGRP
jgi:rhodanese-related sulfurtransferase